MGLLNRSVRFGKYDVTNLLDNFSYESEMIEDKEGNVNSTISTVNVMRTGGSNGTVELPEYKSDRLYPAIIDGYNTDKTTFNKDFHQFPAILTTYQRDTKKIVGVTVFPNCTISKTGLKEPDEKKKQKTATFSWKSEDTWEFLGGNYIYVDEITATKDSTSQSVKREYDLTKSLATATSPILLCMINYETQVDYFYSVEAKTEGNGYTLKIKDDAELKEGDKILVLYEIDSTTIL